MFQLLVEIAISVVSKVQSCNAGTLTPLSNGLEIKEDGDLTS